MSMTTALATGAGAYLNWGVVQISVANLAVIGLMLLVFVLAVLLPFPQAGEDRKPEERS
jgi:hypothetical protein